MMAPRMQSKVCNIRAFKFIDCVHAYAECMLSVSQSGLQRHSWIVSAGQIYCNRNSYPWSIR